MRGEEQEADVWRWCSVGRLGCVFRRILGALDMYFACFVTLCLILFFLHPFVEIKRDFATTARAWTALYVPHEREEGFREGEA